MGWVTEPELAETVAGLLKVSPADLKPYWAEILAQSLTKARRDIEGALLLRGYTLGQIESWDRLGEFHRDIAKWWALLDGAALDDYDTSALKLLDRRGELRTVVMQIGGQTFNPARAESVAEAGVLDAGGDRFTRDCPKW